MERKIRILIADNSSAFSIECQKELGLQGFDVVAIDKDGKKLLTFWISRILMLL